MCCYALCCWYGVGMQENADLSLFMNVRALRVPVYEDQRLNLIIWCYPIFRYGRGLFKVGQRLESEIPVGAFDATNQRTGSTGSQGWILGVYKIAAEGLTIPHLQGLRW